MAWLDEEGLPDGLPFLLSPRFEYDVTLNAYFLQANLMALWNSNANRAGALARFFTFLHTARGGNSWRGGLVAQNAKLKRYNRKLTETLALTACHIQRISPGEPEAERRT